jgi:large subunit ribosomal protein L32e
MSKNFKSQDYFRYPRLGMKWRRPKGRQSKLREKKGGSGRVVAIGYGTKKDIKNTYNGMHFSVVHSLKDLDAAKEAIIISSTLGLKKTKVVAEKAKQMNLVILNKKKLERIGKREKEIVHNKEERKKRKEKKKKKTEKEKAKEHKAEEHRHDEHKHDEHKAEEHKDHEHKHDEYKDHEHKTEEKKKEHKAEDNKAVEKEVS